MKWLIFSIIFFTAIGSALLWFATVKQTNTTSAPKTLLPITYKDPYIRDTPTKDPSDTPAQPPHEVAPPQPSSYPQRHQQQDTTQRTANNIGTIEPSPVYDRRVMERLFFDEVNRQRELRNLKPLILRKDLARTARKYSEELAAGAQSEPGYDPRTAVVELRHFGDSFGLTVVERLAYKKVYDVSRAGENILSIPLDVSTYADDGTLLERSWRSPEDIVTDGVRQWILSSGHRKNILTPEYDYGGIGVFRLDNILVVTQIFITQASCGYYKGPCCGSGDACFRQYTCDTTRKTPECRTED